MTHLSDGEWHRLHPLTPLFRGGLTLVIFAGIIIANLRDRLIETFFPVLGDADGGYGNDPVDWVIDNLIIASLVVLGIVAVLVAGFYLSWRFHSFRITDDLVEVRSGILFRTQRRAPLDRVQGVNLTRPLFARLVGMAKLEVVGAGLDSNVKLDYLSTVNAEEVRADILRLASGARLAKSLPADASPQTRSQAMASTLTHGISGLIEGAEGPVAEPESVVSIPVGRLIASHVLSMGTIVLLVLIGVVTTVSIASAVSGESGIGRFGGAWLILSLVPAILGFGAYWFSSIVKSLRYSIAPTPDGVRITFGLFTTVTETLPPGRIHAVEVSQSILWRGFGWWTVRINRLTGRSAADTSTDQFTTVLPVGTRADVERVLRLILPGIPEAQWPMVFEHGLLGPRPEDPYTNTPSRVRALRPLSWKRNGYLMLPQALLIRRGIVWRQLGIFPFARMQSFTLHQGPLARALGVAAAKVQTVSGRVFGNLGAIDRGNALALFEDAARAAVDEASADRSHRWGEGAEPVVAVAEPTVAVAAPTAQPLPAPAAEPRP